MPRGLRSEISKLALHTFLALMVGLVIGYPTIAVLIGGAIYLYLSYQKIIALFEWIHSDTRYPPARLNDFWGEIADAIYKDRRKLKRIQSKQEQALARVQNIASAMDDGIVILDKDGKLDWCNSTAKAMLDLKTKDRFEPLSNLVRHPAFQTFISAQKYDEPCTFTPTNKPNITFEVTANFFGSDKTEILVVFRDITRLTRLEQMRKDFVGNISHELRTPLTVINGYIDTMETLLTDSKWDNILGQMRNQSNRMTALTDDLTMLSKLETDNYQPKKETIDLNSLIKTITDDIRPISTANHTIDYALPEQTLSISGNYQQLYSAISNLGVNAIKHNPQGCNVSFKLSQTADKIEIRVKDTGKGIASKHLPRLTERFYRTDTDRNSATGGTGLGLAIVKHVLQHHHGELEISSEEGMGSEFLISLAISEL